uniref:Uncharacterized protein n=1 Tax=Rhizophora mucronata TaxID=61149 RepID=A0A2P2NTA9_RHIMU
MWRSKGFGVVLFA